MYFIVPVYSRGKMNVQNIAFLGRANIKNTKKCKKIDKPNRETKNSEGKLKKALIAMGIIGAAGVGVAVLICKRNAKSSDELAQNVTNKVKTEIMLLPEKAESAVRPVSKKANKAAKQVQTEVIYLPETMEKSIVPLQEEVEAANVKIKTEVVNIPEVAQEILEPAHKGVEKTMQPLKKNTWQEATEAFKERVEKATEEYNQRVNDKLKFSKRIKMIKNKNASEGYSFKASKIRKIQLSFLSNEQMNALNDKTLEHLLNNAYHDSGKLVNMKFFKSIPPEQLIKIQESEEGLQRLYRLIENGAYGYEFDCLATFLRNL